MNQLAQLYNNFGDYQYVPLSTGYSSWLGQQPGGGAPQQGGAGVVGGGYAPSLIGGNYALNTPTYANTNWLSGLNQAWNTSGGRGLSSMLGLGGLRAGSNFLEGYGAAQGGFMGGVTNVLANLFGNNPTQAVQDQRDFDAAVALESQDMINRGINPDTGLPFDQAQQQSQREANNAARRASLMQNASINSELDSIARQMQYQNILESRGGARQER